ncbi:MAG TPA: DUF4115 domain-containing protein, partial [Gammaproteobacteria bacterium]|nr:DUF4115 domain-containing protein [Gammaproteobacteria bacterium]
MTNPDASSDDSKEANSAADGAMDFGSILASARKFKNYTVDQISEQLKIPARTITAIEKNDINALPAPTFTQGYIRAYAKFVEASEDKVLAIYNRAVPHENVSDLKARSNLPDEASSQSPMVKMVTIILILGGIATLVYGSFRYYQKKMDVMETALESKQRSFTGNSLNSPGTHRIEIEQEARLTDDDELVIPRSDPAGNNGDSELGATDTGEPGNPEKTSEIIADDPGTGAEGENDREVAISADTLKIFAKKGAWMQVRDASNTRLLYNMVPRGEVKVLQGKAPFRISLGNAKTTSISINDIEIDMSEYIRENNT